MSTIRLATERDLPAILAISNHYALTTPANFAIESEPLSMWEESFRATNEKYPWLVAVEENIPSPPAPLPRERGVVVGFAKASPWKGRCAYAFAAEITVYMHPDHLGKRIGRALYEPLFAILKAQGYRTLLGGITVPNDASVRLHESFGMRRVALLERIGWKFGKWHDVGYWQIDINDEVDAPPGVIVPVREVVGDIVRSA